MNRQEMELNDFRKKRHQELKNLFKGQIHGNFLIKILVKLFEIPGFFDKTIKEFNVCPNNMILQSTNMEVPDYEICRYIVGANTSNTVFKTNEEINALEGSSEYIERLIEDVDSNIRLRAYSAYFYRPTQIIAGDNFGFFNPIIDFFSATIYSNSYFKSLRSTSLSDHLYISLFDRSLAALSLISDNLLNDSYPSCRGMIEIFFKILVLECNPGIESEFNKFLVYEIHNNICLEGFGDDFNEAFSRRKFKKCHSKGVYMQFGWVDSIKDYDFTGNNPYSLSALGNYLIGKLPDLKSSITNLIKMYQFCNAYSHGCGVKCQYPLNEYFNNGFIFANILPYAFKAFCFTRRLPTIINGVNLLDKMKRDVDILLSDYGKKSTENFNIYYQRYGKGIQQ